MLLRTPEAAYPRTTTRVSVIAFVDFLSRVDIRSIERVCLERALETGTSSTNIEFVLLRDRIFARFRDPDISGDNHPIPAVEAQVYHKADPKVRVHFCELSRDYVLFIFWDFSS